MRRLEQLLGRFAGAVQRFVAFVTPDRIRRFFEWEPLRRLKRVERIAVTFVAASPLAMAIVDNMSRCASIPRGKDTHNAECQTDFFRGSISAYYNMINYQWFYVPLMVGALLFAMNGLLRRGHWWNVVIGLSLVGVLLFDKHDQSKPLHSFFTALLFVANIAVFLLAHWHRTKHDPKRDTGVSRWRTREMKFRLGLTAAIAAALVAERVDKITFFWAEWVALGAVCVHFWRDETMHGDAPTATR